MSEEFTCVAFQDQSPPLGLVLKIKPEDVVQAASQKWEITLSKDVRLQALVSPIRSAHLTLFQLLGYRYVLSGGGHFVGRDILGQFFLETRGKTKELVLKAALKSFAEFVHMVRPALRERSPPSDSVPHPV